MGRRRGWGGTPPAGDAEATQRIVAAAVDLIDRTGAAISIAQVAESLGVIRQTVYRYFPTAADLMRAAAIASVDGFLDALTAHLAGIDDPAEAMTEGVIFTLREVPRRPQLGLLLEGTASRADEFLSPDALAFGMAMITRYDVDWVRHGYDDEALMAAARPKAVTVSLPDLVLTGWPLTNLNV